MRTAEKMHSNALQALRPQRETITADEVAQILGLSTWSIYDLVRQRAIPHIRVGRRVLFRRSSILNWVDELEAASIQPEQPAGNVRKVRS